MRTTTKTMPRPPWAVGIGQGREVIQVVFLKVGTGAQVPCGQEARPGRVLSPICQVQRHEYHRRVCRLELCKDRCLYAQENFNKQHSPRAARLVWTATSRLQTPRCRQCLPARVQAQACIRSRGKICPPMGITRRDMARRASLPLQWVASRQMAMDLRHASHQPAVQDRPVCTARCKCPVPEIDPLAVPISTTANACNRGAQATRLCPRCLLRIRIRTEAKTTHQHILRAFQSEVHLRCYGSDSHPMPIRRRQ